MVSLAGARACLLDGVLSFFQAAVVMGREVTHPSDPHAAAEPKAKRAARCEVRAYEGFASTPRREGRNGVFACWEPEWN